ncbi:uncharacterized protein LOC135821335 isoform X1 [Sycon ciliatum]|uniref:uncharacterized protein LOC135821335 isoform X1 n=2 Tax=Sycon ciliatum TaxID=27933 RepID=UPI0031F61BF8
MDADLWNRRWAESFPDASPPAPWPQSDETVDEAIVASQERLAALQDQTRRELFLLMCLRSHLQTMQSVGLSTPTDGETPLQAAFSERASFKRHTVMPSPVRSRSAADILQHKSQDDEFSPPATPGTTTTRALVRRRRVATDIRRKRRRSSQPMQSGEFGESSEEQSEPASELAAAEPATPTLAKARQQPRSTQAQEMSSRSVDPRSSLPGTRDERDNARARLRYLRQHVDGEARKMILGVRRARGTDGSIATPLVCRESDLMSPTERYLPRSLYPSSLLQVSDTVQAAPGRSSSPSSSSSGSSSDDNLSIDNEHSDSTEHFEDGDDCSSTTTPSAAVPEDAKQSATSHSGRMASEGPDLIVSADIEGEGIDVLIRAAEAVTLDEQAATEAALSEGPSKAAVVDTSHTSLASEPVAVCKEVQPVTSSLGDEQVEGSHECDGPTEDVSAAADAAPADATPVDAPPPDAAQADAATADSVTADAPQAVAVADDSVTVDTTTADAAQADAVTIDATPADAATTDAAPADAATSDATPADVEVASIDATAAAGETTAAAEVVTETASVSGGSDNTVPAVSSEAEAAGTTAGKAPCGDPMNIMDCLLQAAEEAEQSQELEDSTMLQSAAANTATTPTNDAMTDVSVPTISTSSAEQDTNHPRSSTSQSVMEALGTPPGSPPPVSDCKTPGEATPSAGASCSETSGERHAVASEKAPILAGKLPTRKNCDSLEDVFANAYCPPTPSDVPASKDVQDSKSTGAESIPRRPLTLTRASEGTVYESIENALDEATPPVSVSSITPVSGPSVSDDGHKGSATSGGSAASNGSSPTVSAVTSLPSMSPLANEQSISAKNSRRCVSVKGNKTPLYERLEDLDVLIQNSISHSGLVATAPSPSITSQPSISSISVSGRSECSTGSDDACSHDIQSTCSGEEIIPAMSYEEELEDLRRARSDCQDSLSMRSFLSSSSSLLPTKSEASVLTSSLPTPAAASRTSVTSVSPPGTGAGGAQPQAHADSPIAILNSLEASLGQKTAVAGGGDSAVVDGMQQHTDEDDSLLMRKMVVMGIVDSEKLYLEVLQIMLNNYCKPLAAVATSSQPIVSQKDCDTIFHNLTSIVDVHEHINRLLEPLLVDWSVSTEVGRALVELVRQLPVYKSYLDNYPRAIDIVTRYRQESGAFSAFLKAAASIKGLKKNVPFEELIQMPVQRLQNYILVMQDLVRYTPPAHPDYASLSTSVADLGSFLANFNTARAAGGRETQCGRKLIQHCTCVESQTSDGRRKFRHLFLYEDTLLCCSTPHRSRQHKEKLECKWYMPLAECIVNPPFDADGDIALQVSQSELNALSLKVNKYKAELKQINRVMADVKKRAKKMADREKIRKRLQESEMLLKQMTASSLVRFGHKSQKYKHVSRYLPGNRISAVSLPTVTGNMQASQPSVTNHVPLKESDYYHKKPYVMLFFGDQEGKEFEDAVTKATAYAPVTELTQFELQDMMAKSKLESDFLLAEALAQEEEDEENVELVDGLMTVFIDRAIGLKPTLLDVTCTMELDTYGHFERKAKTRAQHNNGAPVFEQGFEIELEAAESLVITIFEKGLKVKGRHLGRVTLDLLPYCDEEPHDISIPVHPQGSLQLCVQYFSPEVAARRSEMMKAHTSTSVFGENIETVSLREADLVPAIVKICCSEVEKRGLEETGIYRISGLLSDVKSLKQAFDISIKDAQKLAEEVDVHAVSGCLKLYFREMPEPIFPRCMYNKFVEGLGLSNPEARQQCILSLLYSIPDPNLMTAIHLIKHLKVVSSQSSENKMNNQNLSTVFGPNLFKPDTKTEEQDVSAALDVVSQVGVFVFLLELDLDVLLIEDKLPTNKLQEPPVFIKGHHRGHSNASAGVGGGSTSNLPSMNPTPPASASSSSQAQQKESSPNIPRKLFRHK